MAQVFESRDGPDTIFSRRECKARVDQIEQVMRDAFAFFRGRLGGADVKAAIDLRRIARQDLAAIFPRKPCAQRGLSGGCGSDDGDKRCRPRPRLREAFLYLWRCVGSQFWGSAHRRNFQYRITKYTRHSSASRRTPATCVRAGFTGRSTAYYTGK